MIYNNVLEKYSFVPQNAVEYGFQLDGDKYIVSKPLTKKGFYATFCITEKSVEANVYEEPDGELFLPFNTNTDGSFVSTIRAYVDDILNDILNKCFILVDVKEILLDYVKQKYGTIPESPWGNLKEYNTLNTAKKHKWYGLFMLIPYKYLDIEKEGKIHVLNLKVNPETISTLIDNIHYFKAYHMNKKYWISILLDRDSNVEQIKKLLDNSYAIVDGKS